MRCTQPLDLVYIKAVTFGGNHNFGMVLFNGGTLYIDDGKPPRR